MLGGCSTWEPGPAYSPPRVEMFTDDMISDGPRWSGIGFAQCQPRGFVVGLSHLQAPPPPGEHGPERSLHDAERDAEIERSRRADRSSAFATERRSPSTCAKAA